MATYYVSNTGLDTNNGTSESTPFKTCYKVNTLTLNPGDKVLFKRGDEWIGDPLRLDQQDGTETAYIEIDAYGDITLEKPLISNLAPACWVHENILGTGYQNLTGRMDPSFDLPTGTPWTSTFDYGKDYNSTNPATGVEGTDWYRGPSQDIPWTDGRMGYSTCLVNHLTGINRLGWSGPNLYELDSWAITSIVDDGNGTTSTVTTSSANTFVSGETVEIGGVTFSSKDPNDRHIITVLTSTTFTIPFETAGETLNTGYACMVYKVTAWFKKSQYDPKTEANVPTFDDTELCGIRIGFTDVSTWSVDNTGTWGITDWDQCIGTDEIVGNDIWDYQELEFSSWNSDYAAPVTTMQFNIFNNGQGVGYCDHIWIDRAIKHLDHPNSIGRPVFLAGYSDYSIYQDTGIFDGIDYEVVGIINPDGTESNFLANQFSQKSYPLSALSYCATEVEQAGAKTVHDITELYKDKTGFYDWESDILVYRHDAGMPDGAMIPINNKIINITDCSYIRFKNLRVTSATKITSNTGEYNRRHVSFDVEGVIGAYSHVEIIDCDFKYGYSQNIKLRWPGMIESKIGTPLGVTGWGPGLLVKGCTFIDCAQGALGFHGSGVVEDCYFKNIANNRHATGDASVMNVDNQQDNTVTPDITRLAGPVIFRNNVMEDCGRRQAEITSSDLTFINGAGNKDTITNSGSIDFTEYFKIYDRLSIVTTLNNFIGTHCASVWDVTPTTITLHHPRGGNQLTNESPSSGYLSTVFNQRGFHVYSDDISFNGTAKTITTAGYCDFTDYFSNGDTLAVSSDSETNDTVGWHGSSTTRYTISTVTATTITLDAGDTLTTEDAATAGKVMLLAPDTLKFYEDSLFSWDNGLADGFKVYNNTFKNSSSGTLQASGGAQGIQIYNNIFDTIGLSRGCEGQDGTGTVISSSYFIKLGIGLSSGYDEWDCINSKVYNNVFIGGVDNSEGSNCSAISLYNTDCSGVEVKNNIFYNCQFPTTISFHATGCTSSTNTSIEGNLFYNCKDLFTRADNQGWQDVTYSTFSQEDYVGENYWNVGDPQISAASNYLPLNEVLCKSTGSTIGLHMLDRGGKPFKKKNTSIGIWELAGNRDPVNRDTRE